MAVREILVCAKCRRDIEEDPMLGDKQGGIREIRHMGTTWRITLCVKCVKPIFDLFEDYVEKFLPGGTAAGAEVLKFLPRADAKDGAGIEPPSFSGGES